MTNTLNLYSVASSAARGAKRANVTEAIIFQMDDGKFAYLDMHNLPADVDLFGYAAHSNLNEVAPDMMAAAVARLHEKEKPATAAPVATLPKKGEVVVPVSNRGSYKELARRAPAKSTVVNPVDVIWAFVAENPTMPRKQVITALVEIGINLHTVKTQYQKAKSGKARFAAKAS